MEEYGRCFEVREKEAKEDCGRKVKNKIKGTLKIDIRERYYKRIYREDPKIIYNKSQVLQQVIVKFKGFSPSSSVYGARKWKSNISVQLNLTKRHYLLLKEQNQ